MLRNFYFCKNQTLLSPPAFTKLNNLVKTWQFLRKKNVYIIESYIERILEMSTINQRQVNNGYTEQIRNTNPFARSNFADYLDAKFGAGSSFASAASLFDKSDSEVNRNRALGRFASNPFASPDAVKTLQVARARMKQQAAASRGQTGQTPPNSIFGGEVRKNQTMENTAKPGHVRIEC